MNRIKELRNADIFQKSSKRLGISETGEISSNALRKLDKIQLTNLLNSKEYGR
jgi:hypothetical protein